MKNWIKICVCTTLGYFMYRLVFVLTISLISSIAFGATPLENRYDSEVPIQNEFQNVYDNMQDKIRTVTSSPSGTSSDWVEYSSGTYRALFHGASYYFEMKKR
jgi:hypothetical protein